MINLIFSKILICLVFLANFSCKTNKDITQIDTQDCRTLATVKDFTGLDGCNLLIVLDNGDKLLPASIKDESFSLRDGQRIKLDYTELEDVMSICMAENAAIEITCIELIEGRPMTVECFNTTNPKSVPWMKEVINTREISLIKKHKYQSDEWTYLFLSGSHQFLYDCKGSLLCEQEGLAQNKCINEYVEGAEGKTIYKR